MVLKVKDYKYIHLEVIYQTGGLIKWH